MLLHSIEELSNLRGPIHLAIGVFDGVHLGHQAVLEQALADSKISGGTSVVVTFDPHPMRVLRPDSAPRLLTSTQHKVRILEKLGLNRILMIRFDSEFAATSPETFIRRMAEACSPLKSISVGQQWSFGKNRAGNVELLTQMGDQLGFTVAGVPEIEMDDVPISSTLIRAAVEEGRLKDADRYLGRPFSILGTVEHGEGLGHKLGFPTANLAAHNEQFPLNGVYAVEAVLESVKVQGVVNIGVRPTLKSEHPRRLLELHVFDYESDLYGQTIEVTFRQFLRPEQKFDNLEALKTQIAKDVASARTILSHD